MVTSIKASLKHMQLPMTFNTQLPSLRGVGFPTTVADLETEKELSWKSGLFDRIHFERLWQIVEMRSRTLQSETNEFDHCTGALHCVAKRGAKGDGQK